jgi:hypothetical protein
MAINRDCKVDYIEFALNDIEATKHFYNRVFGWSFEDYRPNYTSFSDGRLARGFGNGDVGQMSGR